MRKKTILVIFGGMSGEHDISRSSASFISGALSRCPGYLTITVGITKEGDWYLYTGPFSRMQDGSWLDDTYIKRVVLSLEAMQPSLIVFNGNGGYETLPIDCVFPVMHGRYGEDGTLQGLLEMAHVPFVGCGVAASALAMDKVLACALFEQQGIPHTPWHYVDMMSWLRDKKAYVDFLAQTFEWPVFVKPSRGGSSLGISKAFSKETLEAAIEKALLFDRRVVVEQGVVGREVEIGGLGGYYNPELSPIGEIIPDRAFYDYDSKYEKDSSSQLIIPAELDASVVSDIRMIALKAWRAFDLYGLARIDFFVTDEGVVLLNEINTIPGFVSISMYPRLFRHAGYADEDLVRRLVELAFEREDHSS
jgi:D-alanine-D-alanine ligase